jgi:hypothetical protein
MIYDFSIGKIYYRIDFDSTRSFLRLDFFKNFKTAHKKRDILFFARIDKKEKASFAFSNKNILKKIHIHPNDHLDDSLFFCSKARDYLESNSTFLDHIVLEARPASLVIFNFIKNEMIAYYTKSYSVLLEESVFRPFAFSHFLVNFSSFMVHGSSLIKNGKTAVFLAPDAGGKSTIAESCPSGVVLSDDQTFIKKEKNKFIAYGTPWGKLSNHKDHAPVGAFFILEKSSKFEVSPIDYSLTLQYLWNEHISNYCFLPNDLKRKAFELILNASKSVPSYKIKFAKNYINWKEIDQILSK